MGYKRVAPVAMACSRTDGGNDMTGWSDAPESPSRPYSTHCCNLGVQPLALRLEERVVCCRLDIVDVGECEGEWIENRLLFSSLTCLIMPESTLLVVDVRLARNQIRRTPPPHPPLPWFHCSPSSLSSSWSCRALHALYSNPCNTNSTTPLRSTSLDDG